MSNAAHLDGCHVNEWVTELCVYEGFWVNPCGVDIPDTRVRSGPFTSLALYMVHSKPFDFGGPNQWVFGWAL